jgi:hypothetical protein
MTNTFGWHSKTTLLEFQSISFGFISLWIYVFIYSYDMFIYVHTNICFLLFCCFYTFFTKH